MTGEKENKARDGLQVIYSDIEEATHITGIIMESVHKGGQNTLLQIQTLKTRGQYTIQKHATPNMREKNL